MVRLDYCILDHILPTGKPTNLTPVRLKNFEKTNTFWARLAQNSKITRHIEFLNYLDPILHNFFPAFPDYTALVKM